MLSLDWIKMKICVSTLFPCMNTKLISVNTLSIYFHCKNKRNFLHLDQTSPVERPTRKATSCPLKAIGWFRVIFKKDDDQKIMEVTIVWVSILCRPIPTNSTNVCTHRVCTLESKIKMALLTSKELKTQTCCSPLIMLTVDWLRHRSVHASFHLSN